MNSGMATAVLVALGLSDAVGESGGAFVGLARTLGGPPVRTTTTNGHRLGR